MAIKIGQGKFGTGIRYADRDTSEPSTALDWDDVLSMPPWEARSAGSAPQATVNGTTVTYGANREHPYRIEVWTAARAFLGTVTQWWGGEFYEEVNSGSRLSFTVKYTDPIVSSLTFPNTIWLRDKYGCVIDVFAFARTEPEQVGDARYIHVTANSRLVQLGREFLAEYATDPEDDIATVINDLIAAQVQDNPLTLGVVSPEIGTRTIEMNVQQTTALAILRQIQSNLPDGQQGFIYVDSYGRLNWQLETGWQSGQVLAINGNMTGVRVTQNWDNLCNRLYAYGEGEDPRNRLNLVDAGEAHEYLDGAAGSITAYGIVPGFLQDKRIRYPETLLARAQAVLAARQYPYIEYDVSVLDLAKADIQRPDLGTWEEIYLASEVRLLAEDIALEDTVRIKSITRNLDNPLRIRVQLDNQGKRISDYVADLIINQPYIDVIPDADRYPHIARLLTTEPSDTDPRLGDLRYVASPESMEFRGEDGWEGFVEGENPITVTGKVVSHDDSGVSAATYQAVTVDVKGHVTAGASLSGEGPIDVDGNAISHDVSGVVAGTNTKVTVDTYGHVTALADAVYTATTFAGLTAASGVPETALARVTAGADAGKVYKVNAAKNAWEEIAAGSGVDDLLITADTVAALPSASGVDERTLARIVTGADEGRFYRVAQNGTSWMEVPELFRASVLPTTGGRDGQLRTYDGRLYAWTKDTTDSDTYKFLCISHIA